MAIVWARQGQAVGADVTLVAVAVACGFVAEAMTTTVLRTHFGFTASTIPAILASANALLKVARAVARALLDRRRVLPRSLRVWAHIDLARRAAVWRKALALVVNT